MSVSPLPQTGGEPVHPRAELVDFLAEHRLVEDPGGAVFARLTGGVSSDIWLVTCGATRLVLKQPLAELRVADVWHAPLDRSRSEAAWLQVVGALVPNACPRVLAFDAERCLLALEYLEPDDHRLWKAELLEGRVDVETARAVGGLLGRIHSGSAGRPELASRFAHDDLFDALRIDPYLRTLAERHPVVCEALDDLVATTTGTKLALVHGDVSPKNILLGPDGPVLLDAECAWWGDPAFDVAFCLNHLLLKCLLHIGESQEQLHQAARAFVQSYAAHVDWEEPDLTLGRVGRLLPALLLARVDGRSPVEYLGPAAQERVRRFALPRILQSPPDLDSLLASWKEAVR